MSEVDYGAYRPITPASATETSRPAADNNRAEGSPLRSQESFDAYCHQVQGRLAEYATQRAHFLRSAYERLTRLLQTARAVEDNTLYNELWQLRVAVKELLESLTQAAAGTTTTQWAPVQSTHINGNSAAPREITPAPVRTYMPVENTAIARTPSFPARVETEPAVRIPRQPMRPLVEIEEDAIKLREQVKNWTETWPLKREDGSLHLPNALRLRAVACKMRRLEEEAGDTEVTEVTELEKDIVALREQAGDTEYTVTTDRNLEIRPTAFQWGELVERHEETACAQEAFEWWVENRDRLTVQDVQPLAEAVAAIQQRFNRLLFRIGARDPFQQQLFDDLRTWAREAQCYLFSLRPKVPIAELVEKAGHLQEAWEIARAPLAVVEGRGQAVEELIQITASPDFAEDLEASGEALREAVMKCKQANTPVSDPRLRQSLLPWSALLEGDDRLKDTVREIQLNWEGRYRNGGLEPGPVDDVSELSLPADTLEAARALSRGKRVLVLGDVKNEQGVALLKEMLQPNELIWPTLTTADPVTRVETAIGAADLVILAIRFSRKDWQGAAQLSAAANKPFVQVPGLFPVTRLLQAVANLLESAKA